VRYDRIWGFNNNMSKRILDELEAVYLRLRETEVEGVAVIKLRVNNGGGDGTTCFKVKIRMNTTKLMNVRITDLDSAEIWSERVRCSSKTKPRLRAE